MLILGGIGKDTGWSAGDILSGAGSLTAGFGGIGGWKAGGIGGGVGGRLTVDGAGPAVGDCR